MKLELWSIGKLKSTYLNKGIEDYSRRISRFHSFQCTEIIVKSKSKDPNLIKKDESQKILDKLTDGMTLVLLDEKGKSYSSIQFSSFIEQKMLTNTTHLVFLIGGPFGFDPVVYQRADHQLRLSDMTFPHDLAKFIFIEQLYRAFTILHHLPYHHQ